jgi:hypothetical protein
LFSVISRDSITGVLFGNKAAHAGMPEIKHGNKKKDRDVGEGCKGKHSESIKRRLTA